MNDLRVTPLSRWFWVCCVTATLLAVSCDTRVLKDESVTVKYAFDVTRVDDIFIPEQPIKNKEDDTPFKDGGEVLDNNKDNDIDYNLDSDSMEYNDNEDNNNSDEDDDVQGINTGDNHVLDENKDDGDDNNMDKIIRCSRGSLDASNSTNLNCPPEMNSYSTLYITVACTLSAIIFIFGLLGNILVIIVIARTRSMHTTTNCYLLSLAVADSVVLLAATLPAIPETFFRVDEWPYGRVMCSLLIFLQYLGVDSSSLSITAFTIERYIAICHPMRAQSMCTLSRAKKIIAGIWGFCFLYCSPWLGLTVVETVHSPGEEPLYKCRHRLHRNSYLMLYMIDLIIFYVIPLIIAIILYLLIGRILFISRSMSKNIQFTGRGLPRKTSQRRTDSRVQVVRMLVVVVVVFASLWLPSRVIVVYNSFADTKYMDLWFLLFARTMVYTNCAINPILYNIMSVKFKRAFGNYLSCWHRRDSLPASSYNEMNTDVWATRRTTNNTARNKQQQQQQQQQEQQLQQHPDAQKCSSKGSLIVMDDGVSNRSISLKSHHNHNNSQKQKLVSSGENSPAFVHQQGGVVCTKNSTSGTTNNNSTDFKFSQLLENAV